MKRRTRAVLAFAVTSVATLNLAALLGSGYRSAPELEPVPLTDTSSVPALTVYEVERREVQVPIDGELRPGRLHRPVTTADVPGVVLVGGAGPHDRDALAAEAAALARAGVAALVVGKRTAGYAVLRRDFGLLAADAVTQARWMAGQAGMDPTAVGLMGWSEGGWVVPIAAADRPDDVAFVVLVSAPW